MRYPDNYTDYGNMQVVSTVGERPVIRIENAGDLEFSTEGVKMEADGRLIPWADAVKALEQYAYPQRFVLGVGESALRRWENGVIEKLNTLTQPKETTMIDKKNFVTPPIKTPAGSLAHRHLGSLVTITLPSGAEITDKLTALAVGMHGPGVVLRLQSVHGDTYAGTPGGGWQGHELDPKSVVLVRRPKAVKAARAKR